MQDMTPDEHESFLLDRPRTAKLATVREDGRPRVLPVWFDLDGDGFIFTTWQETVKAANLQRDGRVRFCVDNEVTPVAFVLVEGTAETREGAEDFLYRGTRIAGRYMGADRAEEYGRRNAVPGELLVRVSPAKIVARKNVSD